MPVDYRKYPPNWKTEIVPTILKRAGELRMDDGRILRQARCEWCKAENKTYVVRKTPLYFRDIEYAPGHTKQVPLFDFDSYRHKVLEAAVRIILTTAHLNRDRTDNRMENLASLCQRCHLNHDREAQHIPNRAYGKAHSEQPKLL